MKIAQLTPLHLSASSSSLTRLIELMIFLVEKREAIKSDHLVCYTAFAKLIRHCLCHHQNNLGAMVISLELDLDPYCNGSPLWEECMLKHP